MNVAVVAVVLFTACSTDASPTTTTETVVVSGEAQKCTHQGGGWPAGAHTGCSPSRVRFRDRTFGETADPSKVSEVATAFLAKGAVLEGMDRTDEAVSEYDEVATRWGDTENPALKSHVALAEERKHVLNGDS